MVAGTLSASVIAMCHGVSLHDAMTAIHYGYESTVATALGNADIAAVPAILAEHGITGVNPELAHEVGGMVAELLNRGGIDSMMWSLSMIMIALVLGGIMERCGYLSVMLNPLLYKVRRVGDFILLVVISCFVSNFFSATSTSESSSRDACSAKPSKRATSRRVCSPARLKTAEP